MLVSDSVDAEDAWDLVEGTLVALLLTETLN